MRDMVEIGLGRTARRTYELDDINIVPPTPGNADFIDKAWDNPATVAERSQQQKGATISWS